MPLPSWIRNESFYKDGELRPSARVFLQEVFLERVEVDEETGCWIYMGGRMNAGGYKDLTWMGRKVLAHRLAYFLWKGNIPMGLDVLHDCDNPPCCNPDHLHPGDDSANAKERRARAQLNAVAGNRAKTHCPHGHEYTPENTYLFKGSRMCKACHKEYSNRYAQRMAAEHPEIKKENLRIWRAKQKALSSDTQ